MITIYKHMVDVLGYESMFDILKDRGAHALIKDKNGNLIAKKGWRWEYYDDVANNALVYNEETVAEEGSIDIQFEIIEPILQLTNHKTV